MAKDIAALFIIDKWFLATKEMKADCRGWYLNLILHQYDKNDLPNDIEELANLADVRMTEYDRFKQVFEQVLKHKFKLNSNGRLENEYAKEIIKAREFFKQKRSNAGKLSYVLKYFRANFKYKNGFEDFVKSNIDLNFDTKNEQVLEQVFKQMSELYINVNVNKDINKIKIEKTDFEKTFDSFLEMRKKIRKPATDRAIELLLKKINKYPENQRIPIIEQSIVNSWQDFFELRKINNTQQNGTKQSKIDAISSAYHEIVKSHGLEKFAYGEGNANGNEGDNSGNS